MSSSLFADEPVADSPSLAQRIATQVSRVRERPLISERHTPWVIMHAVIAYGPELEVYDSEAEVKRNVIEYLCQHARYEGERIFRDDNGQPALPTRGASYGLTESFKVQDHVDQFLMVFAGADVPLDTPIVAEGDREFHVEDMLSSSQLNFIPDQEVGWTLIVIATYLDLDQSWTSDDGNSYDLEDIVALAVERDTARETEGGPHHLDGVAYALNTYSAQHEGELTGVWADARKYLDRHVELTREYQQEDGSFSAAMFRSSRAARSPADLVWATGHNIEWLSSALTPEQLSEPWVAQGVAALLDTLEAHPLDTFRDGSLYHAMNGLRRYSAAMEQLESDTATGQ